MRFRKNRYSFLKKRVPAIRKAVIVSCISLLFLIAAVAFSLGSSAGWAGTLSAILGIDGIIIALYGGYLGIFAISEDGMSQIRTAIGMIFSGIVLILWIGVFIMGLRN